MHHSGVVINTNDKTCNIYSLQFSAAQLNIHDEAVSECALYTVTMFQVHLVIVKDGLLKGCKSVMWFVLVTILEMPGSFPVFLMQQATYKGSETSEYTLVVRM